jgi:dTDP-4-amino-4,6-dideoxygalactose transaminase
MPLTINFSFNIRYDFMAGKIDKYEWIDLGSSYVPSEVSCAILWAQLEHSAEITSARLANFHTYAEGLSKLSESGAFGIPCVPDMCATNAHIFSLLLPTKLIRIFYETEMKRRGVSAFSHYVPLHSSPAGIRYGRVAGGMTVTDSVFAGLIRLPLWVGLRNDELQFVINALKEVSLLAEKLPKE